MTTEFDLACATCGGRLAQRSVPGDALRVDVAGSVPVAECEECGGRYFPEHALERLH